MKVKLSEATRALANGTANDDERPILTGVKITKTEAVVANGFLLVIKTLQSQGMNLEKEVDDGINEVVIPADALKACKGDEITLQTIETVKVIAKAEILDASATTMKTKVVARMEGNDFNVEADSIEGKYPDYDNLIGGVSPLVGQVAFSTNVLKKLLKTLPNDSHVQFRISDVDKPVEFQCADPDGDIPIRGIVMPITLDWKYTQWKTKVPLSDEPQV